MHSTFLTWLRDRRDHLLVLITLVLLLFGMFWGQPNAEPATGEQMRSAAPEIVLAESQKNPNGGSDWYHLNGPGSWAS